MSKSNQSKFPLAVVINMLTALSFGYVCFLGANFYTLGETTESIIVASIVTILLIATSLGAKLLKQTTRNFKVRFIWEIILLVLFTLITANFTYFPFSHYFVVVAKKDIIQDKLIDNINQADSAYFEYENYVKKRINVYDIQLNTAIVNRTFKPTELKNFGINENLSVSISVQKKNQIDKVNYLLFPENYIQIKNNDSAWLTNARVSVNNWEPISLVNVVNNVEKNTTNSLQQLVDFSKNRGKNESYPLFRPSEPHHNNVNNYFTTFGTPSPFSIVLAFFSYLLMLLSWFITRRDTRSTGALTTAEYEIVL
jgi:hypothetical protein